MTPDSPSPHEGTPLPPRHRPMINTLGKDTMESDLWSFDDGEDEFDRTPAEVPQPSDPEAPADPLETQKTEDHQPALEKAGEIPAASVTNSGRPVPEPVAPAPRTRRRSGISFGEREANGNTGKPAPAFPDANDATSETGQLILPGARNRSGSSESGVSLSVSVIRSLEPESTAKPADMEDLGELDDWDEPDPPRHSPPPDPPISNKSAPVTTEEETVAEDRLISNEPAPGKAETDEFTAKPAPKSEGASLSSLRPKLGLTVTEKLGLAILAVMLVSACAFALHYTLGRLPTSSERAPKLNFPVKGKLTTVTSAVTYWREPVTEGDSADIVRRGTLLIPVIDLEVAGSSGALRIFFRDSTGRPVGDAISSQVPSSGKLSAAASAGFEGAGDYAAYSTEETEPWSVEVHEGPSAGALFQEFNKLFEMPVSTTRR